MQDLLRLKRVLSLAVLTSLQPEFYLFSNNAIMRPANAKPKNSALTESSISPNRPLDSESFIKSKKNDRAQTATSINTVIGSAFVIIPNFFFHLVHFFLLLRLPKKMHSSPSAQSLQPYL